MIFKHFFLPDTNEANTYIVGCGRTREAMLIDAGADTREYDEFLERANARLTGIFLTHFHWDHDGGLDSLLDRFDVPVYSMTGQTRNGVRVKEHDTVPIGKLSTVVYRTTGHTPDSLTLVVENRIAFVGDALFAGSIGGTASPALQEEEKSHIRGKIFSLPPDTLLCPGHGPLTTVSIEKTCNPFFV